MVTEQLVRPVDEVYVHDGTLRRADRSPYSAVTAARTHPSTTTSTVVRVRSKALLAELEPTTARLLDRHLASAKEWFPHELVPWSRGRDFDECEPFDPDDAQLSPRCAARSR